MFSDKNGDFRKQRSVALVWTAKTELSENAAVTTKHAVIGSIRACAQDSRKVRKHTWD